MKTTVEPSELIHFLKDRYIEIRKKKSGYSLTAYARDLGFSQPFLSRLLKNERQPTVRVAAQVAAACGVNQKIADQWISQIVLGSNKNVKMTTRLREAYEVKAKVRLVTPVQYDVEKFRLISQWYHLAILYLTYVDDFKSDPRWIAKRLGITAIEASQAIDRMLSLGVLAMKGKELVVENELLLVEAQTSDIAVREFHKQMSERAIEALKDGSREFFEKRVFSSVTFAVNPDRIPEFKAKVKAFQSEVLGMLKSDSYSEVYHLNLQLFPLTHLASKERK